MTYYTAVFMLIEMTCRQNIEDQSAGAHAVKQCPGNAQAGLLRFVGGGEERV